MGRAHVHDNASKAAIEGLTRGLAMELGPRGITVNAIAPGFVWTAQSTSREHSLGPEGLEVAADYIPLRPSARRRKSPTSSSSPPPTPRAT